MSFARAPHVRRAILPLLLLLACSDGGDGPVDPDPDGIGPEGGTAAAADGNAALVIPPGALDLFVEITVAPDATPTPDAGLIAGTAYAFEPDGLIFDVPAALTIEYQTSALPAGASESELAIFRSAGGGAWQPVTSVVDSANDRVVAAINGFSTYAILYREEDGPPPPTGIDAAVVDVPIAAWQFTDVAPAATYACAHRADSTAVVELRTNRSLALDSLQLACSVRFVIAEGNTPGFDGSGAGPTVIRAAGDLTLTDLALSDPLGLIVRVVGRLQMTNVVVDGPIDVHVVESVGTVANAALRAPMAGGALIADVESGERFGLHIDAGVDVGHEWQLNRVSAPSVVVDGDGYLGATAFARVSETFADELKVDLELRAGARFEASGNVDIALLDGTFDVRGDHDIRFEANAAADMRLEFKGVKATVAMEANTFGNGTFRTSVQDIEVEVVDQVLEDLNLELLQDVLAPSLQWNQNGGGITGDLVLTAVDIQSEDAFFGLDVGALDVGGNITGQVKARAGIKWNDLLTTSIELQLEGDESTIEGDEVEVTGAFEVGFGPLSVRGGIRQLHLDAGGKVLVTGPSALEAAVLFDFVQATGIDILGGAGPGGSARLLAGAPRAAGDSIVIRNATINTPDTATAGILISGFDEPILIERATISGDPLAIIVEDASDVTIRGSRVNVGENIGVSLLHVSGLATFESDTLEGGSANGIVLSEVAEAELHDVVIDLGQGIGIIPNATPSLLIEGGSIEAGVGAIQINQAVDLTLDGVTLRSTSALLMSAGRVTATGTTFRGFVVLTFAARGSFTGNTWVGAQAALHDTNQGGGLFTNPLGSNSGLNGGNAGNFSTFVDFDGNDCADYPTSRNEKDDDGNCDTPGVPPPTP